MMWRLVAVFVVGSLLGCNRRGQDGPPPARSGALPAAAPAATGARAAGVVEREVPSPAVPEDELDDDDDPMPAPAVPGPADAGGVEL